MTFGHRPFLTEPEQLDSWRPGRRDRRRTVRRLDHQPAGRPLRSAGHPGHRVRAGDLPHGPRARDLRLARGRRLRRRLLPARPDRGIARQHQGTGGGRRVARHRARRARRRPLDHVARGDGGGRRARLRQRRHRPLRRSRRHRRHHRRQPGQPRHADAPADRVRRRARHALRAGRIARLLAAAGHVRVDARAGHGRGTPCRRSGNADSRP